MYASPSSESYSYSAGSAKLLSVASTNTLQLTHDGVGNRTEESFPGKGTKRTYTYLPDGRLGSIVTGTATVNIRYDAAGQPVTITHSDNSEVTTYELFQDAAGTLLAAEIVTPDGTIVRWHYHYLAGQPVATTREVVTSSGTNVNVFWFIYDERGLIHYILDGAGTEYFRAAWDASGIRHTQLEAANVWVPFALPGQFILYGTEAASPNGTRPPIHLNGARAYDPLTGSFLSPDPADPLVRTPEGYAYARSNPLLFTDPTGTKSFIMRNGGLAAVNRGINSYWLDETCREHAPRIQAAMALAVGFIITCDAWGCMITGRAIEPWLANLFSGRYTCVNGGYGEYGGLMPGNAIAATGGGTWSPRRTWISPAALHGLREDGYRDISCLAASLAHEALHTASNDLIIDDYFFSPNHVSPDYRGKPARDVFESRPDPGDTNEAMTRYLTRNCFPCTGESVSLTDDSRDWAYR